MRKILFASSEVHPVMKTGGLADVSASLPSALHQLGQDVRIIMPAYRASLQQLGVLPVIATFSIDGFHGPIELFETTLPGTQVTLLLVNSPSHFDRDGGPYGDSSGLDWVDNPERFAVFCRAVVAVACNQVELHWQPEIVHCNDWQTGLVPALLSAYLQRPKTVFTIHNMAYQGLFSREVFDALALPESLWQMDGVEFYGLLSFMKGGLFFADHITTVSQTYAEEICHYEFGYGLEGLLALRSAQQRLSGIVNGIDTEVWDPATDTYLAKNYNIKTVRFKGINKQALQQQFDLKIDPKIMVFGLISRLVSQKGIDLSLYAMDRLLGEGHDIQLICLGSGEADFEQQLRIIRSRYPDRVGVQLGYDEALAHHIEAGADAFLMPSRFEPCGLNQLYSLRYGTLPIVRHTGGLADTVIDVSDETLKNGSANGFSFQRADGMSLYSTLLRAIDLYRHPRLWRNVMLTAMAQDVSWQKSADTYLTLYQEL